MTKKKKILVRVIVFLVVVSAVAAISFLNQNKEVQGDDFSRISANPVTTESYFSLFY